MKMALGTLEIARLCHVSPRTVSKWIDNGLLAGWRVPGSRTRRCGTVVVAEFLAAHGMPVPDELRQLLPVAVAAARAA